MEETIILKREQPSKCEVLGAAMAFGAIGFWFGIGATLAVKTVLQHQMNKTSFEDEKPRRRKIGGRGK